MKPVKYRDGFSGQGGKDATFLDTSSTVPYLKKRRFDPETGGQVVAHKRGDFLEVTREGTLEDGFYSIGMIDGEKRVVGSATARGRFTDRGTFIADDGLLGVDRIRYYGRGLGLDTTSTLLGTATDFDGKPCNAYKLQTYRTRDGRRFVAFYDFTAFAPFEYGTQFTFVPGEVYGPPGARKFQSAYVYQSLDPSGQHYHAFLRDDGTTRVLGDTLYMPNQLATYAAPARIAPGRHVFMGAYLRPHYSGSSVDAAACPGLVFQFTDDAGATWNEASSTELFQEFFDTIQTLPVPSYATMFNTAVNACGFYAAPLNASRALAYVVVPYAPNPGADFVLKAKVKLGIIDANARTLLSTLTLFDGEVNAALAFWSGGCVGVEGGAVVVTRPLATVYTNIQNEPPVLLFTPDGVSIATMPPAPQPNYRIGMVSAIAPGIIVAPMYDGAHSLFESRDRGATWQKRAVLTDRAAAPVSDVGKFQLEDFAALTFLRRNGQPAGATPGTPWASDSRIAPPI
ncbi:hypothetical protein EJP67_16640 [Variovorax guangxiensis]|uniref:Exo-alpha-sialidase n=1 Tax=Variovorax guangxiensis TaxID=1775474 RepID=A0A433MKW0_9BURK|nr:hypothetical protein [Variovorax guangxiensis]RUR68691.1 hypothetical protein EJP67_16640 [Variovorax guangxiensis]